MAADIYSKAGADAAFLHDTAAGRQALAQSPEIISTFVPVVKTAVLTRDAAGRITSAVENGVTVTYTRDAQGRIQSETKNGKTTTYTRDASGRVSGWETV